jgi:hypothetical protein
MPRKKMIFAKLLKRNFHLNPTPGAPGDSRDGGGVHDHGKPLGRAQDCRGFSQPGAPQAPSSTQEGKTRDTFSSLLN